MKRLAPLTLFLALFFVACEADVPQPEMEIEIVEMPDNVGPTQGQLGPDDMIFAVVEEMPRFDGGEDAWNNYLKNALKYPEEARNTGIEGKVITSFVVRPDGTLTDIMTIRGIGAGCDEEVIRLLTESPPWTPGEQRGRKVPTRLMVSITFKI